MSGHEPLAFEAEPSLMMNACARAYGLLLRLYPDNFQRQFRVQMVLDFEDGYEEARQRGTRALVAFLLSALVDWLISLVEQLMVSDRLVIACVALCATLGAWAGLFYVASFEWRGTNQPIGDQWPPPWPETGISRLVLPMISDQMSALALMAAVAIGLIGVVLVLTYWLLLPALRTRARS
jgi:hypothetical protein